MEHARNGSWLCEVAAKRRPSERRGERARPRRASTPSRHWLRRWPECSSTRWHGMERVGHRPVVAHARRRWASRGEPRRRRPAVAGSRADGQPSGRHAEHRLHRRARHLEPGTLQQDVSTGRRRGRPRRASWRRVVRIHLLTSHATARSETGVRGRFRVHAVLRSTAMLPDGRRTPRGAAGSSFRPRARRAIREYNQPQSGALVRGTGPVIYEGIFRRRP